MADVMLKMFNFFLLCSDVLALKLAVFEIDSELLIEVNEYVLH